ncbi:GPP34 family phosphoprotein [Saccharopolyspora sp. NPDC050389]|uniref:GPP34 family phosphoprotein n=1 Tax=Saccharopolyspora sp. NPDC050389 TaxID=3155516 RepID=UPI0033E205CD
MFRTTRLPADDPRHEAELRRKIRAVLEDGESSDTRTAAAIALLSSSGTLPALRPALPWSAEVPQAREGARERQLGARP